jgi:multidrug efflux pump
VNLFEPFVRRPVATTLVSLGIILAGGAAYFQLPVAPLPKVDIPVIAVTAGMAGASPEVMARSVATPLERHLGAIAGVNQMSSFSSVGGTTVVLFFDLNRDPDGSARDVQAAINAAKADLPVALRSNPTYRKFDPASAPVLILSLTSDTLTQGQLYDAAATILQQPLSQVPGVGNVNIGGSSLPAVRVEVNPTALFKYGIGLENVRAALANANADSPKGAIENERYHWQIYSNDQAETAAQYRNLIVAYRNGAPIRLSTVADVTDSVEDTRNMGVSNDRLAVLVFISRQAGANIIETIERVKALLPALQAAIPGAAQINVAVDRSTMIQASLRDAQLSLAIAVLLVILVVYCFLGDGYATLIPGVAVPLSIIGTFGAMYLLDYTLDTFSLIALTIATGFVVDDAIVVMENTVRHMELGTPRFEAALIGVKEVGFTVLSMTLSLLAVFSPILFMGGIAGRLFHEFAATLSVAIVISMVVSLTTTPMMCALFLRDPRQHKPGAFHRMRERFFQKMLRSYEGSLLWALRHQGIVLGILVATVVLNGWLFIAVRKGFAPREDTGLLRGSVAADQTSSFQRMTPKLRQFVDIVQADPAVKTVVGTMSSGANSASMFVNLKPLNERKVSAEEIINRLRPQLTHVAGATLYLNAVQTLGGGGGGGQASTATYQYSLTADDLGDLRLWTDRLVKGMKTEPVFLDVNSDQQDKGLKAELVINRDLYARLGLTNIGQVDSTLYDAFGQRLVSTIYKSLNQYHVVMTVQPQFWQDPSVLNSIYVSTSGGSLSGTQASNVAAGTVVTAAAPTTASAVAADAARNAAANSIAATGKGATSTAQAVSTSKSTMIPLSAFTQSRLGTTPLAVSHQGGFVTATISFNLAPGKSLSEATVAIERQKALIRLPTTIGGGFQGSAADFSKFIGNAPLLILAAFLGIYIVLGVLYESFAHPFTILSTLPSAGVGAFLALIVFNNEFNIIGMMGLFLLIGIVKKNAIMMIDLAIELERNSGLEAREAIFQASLLRFRPIMMTTMAALLGALPLAIGFGSGAEFRRPLGISVAGGLIVSQILTIYTTPVVYLFVDRVCKWWAREWAKLHRPQAHPNAAAAKA